MCQFRRFDRDVKPTVWRTEMRVYSDRNERVAGSIDMLARNARGVYTMYDWKRSHKDLYDCGHRFDDTAGSVRAARGCRVCYGRRCRGVLSHMPDTPFVHYSMQQSVYAHLLRAHYGIDVQRLHLVQLTPERDEYTVVQVPELRREVQLVFADRRARLKRVRRLKGTLCAAMHLTRLLRDVRMACEQPSKRARTCDI